MIAPRSERESITMPSTAPRKSVRSIVARLKSVPLSSEPAKTHPVRVASAKSTSRSTHRSKVTFVSCEPRKFTESSLQALKVTRRSSDPNNCAPAREEAITVASSQFDSIKLVPVSRMSRIQTSRNVLRCSLPPVIDTRLNAHSRNFEFGALGSSRSSCSNITVS